MEKKISFGFNKKAKQPSIVSHKPKKEENTVEFIDCLEGQSIKIKNSVVEEEKAPLEIPLKENARGVLDRIKEFRNKQSELKQEHKADVVTRKLESELTLDELAAKALIEDAENREKGKSENSEQIHELPHSDNKLVLEGAEEPTLDDYEKVPFTDYGRAMLRGMGWKDGMGLGKNPKVVKEFEPKARLKGLGLGAHKMIINKPKENVNNNGKELILKPKAFAKIITGRHQGQYCQVQSMDDENSLVIVKTAIKGEILKLNEVFVVPVTKDEYNKFSRVLNNEKYEEYKEISDKNLEKQRHDRRKDDEKTADHEKPSSSNVHYNYDRRTNHKSDFNTSTDSEDNTDSSPERRSRKHRRRIENRSNAKNHNSSSESDPSEYRRSRQFPRRQRHRLTDKSSSSSSSSLDKRRRNRNSRDRSRSLSNESGYEHHKRRRYKTKCRHRRYSDDESEKTYKKNRKSKR